MKIKFLKLKHQLKGAFYFEDHGLDNAMRMLYSTDSSVYQEKPIAVALDLTPGNEKNYCRTTNHFSALRIIVSLAVD